MTERLLAKPRVLAVLAAVQAADAAACVGPIKPVKDSLEKVGLPQDIWWLLPVVKTASAAGLIGGIRWSALGRLTTFMLTVYFTLAVGAHLRAHDKMLNALPATSLLALFAVLTAKGFDEPRGRRVRARRSFPDQGSRCACVYSAEFHRGCPARRSPR
ncbi:Uncharacterised protein [Mycobacteroides abscessus subsp. abscessus]|nr:Uncharacterised protein [Mycobacteroides abscessus subsp. abscessus]SHZ02842.1 Uncharacterised protein [Mycobacteroides abscessus subsp. abscessus]SHZ18844.1 Uncharacterised protein [Mycobacteroides abscessus subsp. abscessus]SIE51691.1 Uncharacterised protein [Mycobacteroides abscessus subsp. abscessus]SIF31296.1 Uncharacterised protein [Mycobacteroides abscessus subsp. abscessus]